MTNCETIQKLISELLNESDLSVVRVDPHFAQCQSCQTWCKNHFSFLSALRHLNHNESQSIDETFFEAQRYSILAQIEEEEVEGELD